MTCTKSESSARNLYWDVAKGALMSLVVLGHLAQVYLEKVGGGGGRSLRLRRSCV